MVLSIQGHPSDRFGGISVRKVCNRLSVMKKLEFALVKCHLELSQCVKLTPVVFGELVTKKGQLEFS